MESNRVFFPGLDSLRFFAATAVFFTHVELMKKFNGFGSHWIDPSERIESTAFNAVKAAEMSWLSPVIANSGGLGVVFFFVLSGFLITYLLLKEREQTGTIAIRKFYLRRILRIWPLYYFLFLIGFLLLPHLPWFHVPMQQITFDDHYWVNFISYALFLPNLAFAIYTRAVPNIGQSWSIGVEEQFYLIWPLFIKYAKRTLMTILAFTIGLLVIKAIVVVWYKSSPSDGLLTAKRLLAMSKIECMSLGGLGAYWLHRNRKKWLDLIYLPIIQVGSVLIIPFLVFFAPMQIQDGLHIVYSFAFLVIILNVATNPKTLFKIDLPWLSRGGKISYGIYMYHVLVINFVLHLMMNTMDMTRDLSAVENLVLYSGSFVLTIAVSSLSYRFLEKPFIGMKKAVTTIKSGNEELK